MNPFTFIWNQVKKKWRDFLFRRSDLRGRGRFESDIHEFPTSVELSALSFPLSIYLILTSSIVVKVTKI